VAVVLDHEHLEPDVRLSLACCLIDSPKADGLGCGRAGEPTGVRSVLVPEVANGAVWQASARRMPGGIADPIRSDDAVAGVEDVAGIRISLNPERQGGDHDGGKGEAGNSGA